MSYNPTMEELRDHILYWSDTEKKEYLHMTFCFVDCKTSLVKEAWQQIERAVICIESGISDPKDFRAEALLLMIFQEMGIHGYTPKV